MKTKTLLAIGVALCVAACGQTRNSAQTAANASRAANAAQPASAAVAGNAATGNAAQAATPADAGNQTVELIPEGFSSGSRGLHHSNMITLGQPRDQVVAQLSAILGQPSATARNEDCPTGAVDVVSYGALAVTFEGGRFAGWTLDGPQPALETYHGLAIGVQRSALRDELAAEVDANSTLGTELTVNGIGALMSGAGASDRVTTLFTGITCFAR